MPPPRLSVPIFHISPEWCGQDRLTQIFLRNGLTVACHENGSLAEEIFFAKAQNRPPLTSWAGVDLFTGLYRLGPAWRPPLEAWRLFAFLRQHFPDAVFIETRRDPDGWLLDRLLRDNGQAARCHARHLGLPVSRVPALWLDQWRAHRAAVAQQFGGDPRLVRIDLDRHKPQDVPALLAGFVDLPRRIWGHRWHPDLQPEQIGRLEDVLDDKPAAPPEAIDDIARDIANFCTDGLIGGGGELRGVSQIYAQWDGGDGICDRQGRGGGMAIAALPDSPRRIALAPPAAPFKMTRAESVINEALALDRAQPLRIDMEDSRWFDQDETAGPGQPVLCHNRRKGAKNVVLWPLPGLHDVTATGFDPATPADPIPYEDKLDQIYWRGMISGHLVTGAARPGPPSFHFLTRLTQAGSDHAARQKAWDDLARTSRLAFVRKWFAHPDFDLGVVMAWRFRHYAADPFLAPFCKPRAGRNLMVRYRYQLCLAGYDHGSNFISAISSNSVLFKEDDGWEVFYSGRFKPWKHYIPIERYGADIIEKLAWARENPMKCKRMSELARAEVARLGDPELRRRVMGHILDALAVAG